MNKRIISFSILLAILISCNSNSQQDKSNEKAKKISKRNYSINPSNAYNNVFFDSMKLVEFIAQQQLDDTISRRIISFYNTRNYQFAWFDMAGLTEQARGFWNMRNYLLSYGKDTSLKDNTLQDQMDKYSEEEDGFPVSATDKKILQTELKMTKQFIQYSLQYFKDGYVKRKEMERFVPYKKEDPLKLADSLLSKKHKNDKYYEDVNKSYKLLKTELERYYAIAKEGGWEPVNSTAKKLIKGVSSPEVLQLKKRLYLTGDMQMDTTVLFNDALEAGIRHFQPRYGYSATGVITDQQIKDLNVPVVNRIEQILLNMGRMQWMIQEPKGEMIVVNIPEFMLHVKNTDKKVFDMVVVVGKEGHNTVMFTGNLNQVVFSPYWNLPSSIVQKEIVPAMNRNTDYLQSHHMEITGERNGLPVIRQLPGGDNSLGKVKFLFPNSYNIYFHDTPAKSLFGKDKRAYSHGCIRLSDPQKMAEYLLKDDKDWDKTAIVAAMNSDKEKYVKLKNPVPVLITYYTAWVDDNGLLHFADDIYGHDKEIKEKMFIIPATNYSLGLR